MAWRRTLRQLPAGLTLFASIAGGPAALRASGEAVPLNAVSVPPGATMTITFDVDVDSPLGICASAIANQGTVTGTGISVATDDPDVGGASDPTATPLDVVDLAITKTDGAATEIPGTPVTYTIVASNAGPNGAVGVTVADTFPANLNGCSTTSIAAGGATGNDPGPTAGNINDGGITLPSGAAVTYTSTCHRGGQRHWIAGQYRDHRLVGELSSTATSPTTARPTATPSRRRPTSRSPRPTA